MFVCERKQEIYIIIKLYCTVLKYVLCGFVGGFVGVQLSGG